MHEHNFTAQIVQAILAELNKYPGARPRRVKVQVGEMLHLVPESVHMHYEFLARGTRLEGVQLELSEVPVRIVCCACGFTGPVEDHHMLVCLGCFSRAVEVSEGDSVRVSELELDEASAG